MICILLFLCSNDFIMAQKVEFNDNGLNIVQLGLSVKELTGVKFVDLKQRTDLNLKYGIVNAQDDFHYYYIVSDSMYIENGGLFKDIFFAVDKSEKIRGIILMFEEFSDEIIPAINTVFGNPNIKSKSPIGEKAAWKKNDVSLLMSIYSDGDNTKISITNTSLEENSPGVSNFIYRTFD